MHRVVLDTNILISALITDGVCRRILEKFIDGTYTLVLSDEVLMEFHGKIRSKFSEFVTEAASMEVLLRQHAKYIKIGEVTINDCRDSADNAILQTAYDGGADIVVSGDNDLLVLDPYQGIRIQKPGNFLKEMLPT